MDNSQANVKRIKEYRDYCGVSNREICDNTKGGYRASHQYLGQVLNGQSPCSDEMCYEVLNAISRARAIKIRNREKMGLNEK